MADRTNFAPYHATNVHTSTQKRNNNDDDRVTPAVDDALRLSKKARLDESVLTGNSQVQEANQTRQQQEQENQQETPTNRMLQWIAASRKWKPDFDTPHPLVENLRNGRDNEKGWLREETISIDRHGNKRKKQLTSDEKSIIIHAFGILKMLPQCRKNGSAIADLSHAYGVNRTTINFLDQQYIGGNLSMGRKPRRDKGEKLLDNNKKNRAKT